MGEYCFLVLLAFPFHAAFFRILLSHSFKNYLLKTTIGNINWLYLGFLILYLTKVNKMKFLTPFLLFLSLSIGLSNVSYAQSNDEKQQAGSLFESTEKDSMQIWFYNRATAMGLKDEKREEYYNIILYHTFKMTRLENKEKGYTQQEVRAKFEALVKKQHSEIKAILDKKQYAYYLDIYNKILKSVYERKGWK